MRQSCLDVEEILKYIVAPNISKTNSPKIEEDRHILKRTITSREKNKDVQEEVKKKPFSIDDILDEVRPKRKEEIKHHAGYELFIPVESMIYDSVEISYRSRDNIEEIEIEIGKEKDKIGMRAEKRSSEAGEYSIIFSYDKANKGYNVKYEANDYSDNLDKARQDFTNRLDKTLDLLPKSIMGGVLGFTYLGSGKMTRRDDLFGDMALMVDVHEAIHTPDEYETRVLTDWMLKVEGLKYKS